MRNFNNLTQTFDRSGKNALLNAVGGVGIKRYVRNPPFLRGVPGYKVSSGPGIAAGYVQQFPKRQQISLANLITDVQYNISGTILWFQASTNVTDQLLIRIGDLDADQLPWGPGNGIEGVPFSRIFVTVPIAVAGATATLVYLTDTPQNPVRFF